MQKCAEYFNIDYRTILRHLDTKLATKQNGQLIYLFTSELSYVGRNDLLSNLTKASPTSGGAMHRTRERGAAKMLLLKFGVYKEEQMNLINENQPTFTSKSKGI
jgi:hypothetical protein